MAEIAKPLPDSKPAVSEEGLRKAEAMVEQEEGVINRLIGWPGMIVTSIAVAMSDNRLSMVGPRSHRMIVSSYSRLLS